MVGTNKSLGQHWLKNREILEQIAELAADGVEATQCLEIGPGLGFLTSSLLKRFERVVAVEYDERLAEKLPDSFPGKNLEVVHEDILDSNFGKLMKGKKYVVAGNIPYYITQPIIGKVLEAEHRPERAVLLMQKEVAERVLATHGNTPLSMLVENNAEVEAGPVVSRKEFEPAPKVDSQVVVFKMRKQPLWLNPLELAAVSNMAFDAPRKKISNNLQAHMGHERTIEILTEAKIDPNARPGDLGLEDYRRIWSAMEFTERQGCLMGLMGVI